MKSVFIAFLALTFSFHVSAGISQGANGSGGGMGVVCKNLDGSIKTVELLDLWEARVIYSRNTISSASSVADQVEQSLQNFKNSVYAAEMCVGSGFGPGFCNGVQGPEALYKTLSFETSKFLALNLRQVHRLKGAILQKTNDAFEVVTPNGCSIEQLVLYKDTSYGGDILINQDLVDHMDKTNEAALYIHEAFYAFLRQPGKERSSIRVRRAVGLSFSGYKFRTLESFLPQQYYECSNHDNPLSRVFVYAPDTGLCAGNGIVFQVVDVAGMYAIDFEDPDTCRQTTIDQLFNSEDPMQSLRPFGSQVGFDYSVLLSIGGMNGLKQGTFEFLGGPGHEASPKVLLNCNLKTK